MIEIGLGVVFDEDQFAVVRSGTPVDLTVIEARILRHLVQNPRIVLSHQALLQAGWGGSGEFYDRGALYTYPGSARSSGRMARGPIMAKRGVGYVFRPS